MKKFVDLPCSPNGITENVKRAYLQARMWLEAPFWNAADRMDPTDFGYDYSVINESYEPTLFKGPQKPTDLPDPCTCKKCARKTCACRESEIPCCVFCKFTKCQNPFN